MSQTEGSSTQPCHVEEIAGFHYAEVLSQIHTDCVEFGAWSTNSYAASMSLATIHSYLAFSERIPLGFALTSEIAG